MHTKKHRYVENPDVLRRKVTEVIRLIHQDADPHELNAYKRFVKKHVSIFSRAYFTAYLVKMLAEGRTLEAPRKGEREESRRTGEKRSSEQAGNLVPENKQTLFVSVGKNRRVYPKDFVALFAELDGVQGDDIGQIKILDNYSFVEVDKRVAESIIETYNGFEYRGRKLTVNYARNK